MTDIDDVIVRLVPCTCGMEKKFHGLPWKLIVHTTYCDRVTVLHPDRASYWHHECCARFLSSVNAT